MCLIALALNAHPKWPLLMVANRDEFLQRPTQALHPWPDIPGVVAGRDLRGGGTWLAASEKGRLAAVTNVRDPALARTGPSRGQLPVDYMLTSQTSENWFAGLSSNDGERAGYNLLAFELDGRPRGWWHSNATNQPHQSLEAGVHVLSNGQLNDPWPKVERLRRTMLEQLDGSEFDAVLRALLEAMLDERHATPETLPDTGVGQALEQALSPPFIRMPEYATRSTTAVWLDEQRRLHLVEYRHNTKPCEEFTHHDITL